MSEAEKIISTMKAINDTLKSGFSDLVGQIIETNNRLGETNERVDALGKDMNEGFASVRQEMNEGFTAVRQDMNEELTAVRQDMNTGFASVNRQMSEGFGPIKQDTSSFKQEMVTRLDGIGGYLRSINGTLVDHGQRINNLEQRVTKLEGEQGAA